MNNRNLAILLVILVIMAGGYWWSKGHRKALDQTGGWVDVVPGQLSTDTVYGLSVYRGSAPDEGFTLAKQDDVWVMTTRYDAKASLNRLRTLLTNLENLEGEVRSDDPSVLADYGLDDSTAVHVILREENGDELLHLLLGKPATGGGFIRLNGSNQALLASRNLLSEFGIWGEGNKNPVASTWLDLEIFKPDREKVVELVLRKGKKVIAMHKVFQEKAEGDTTETAKPRPYEWEVTQPRHFTALKTRADGILTTVVNMRGRDVAPAPDDPEEYGLGKSADKVEVVMDDGTRHVMLFGKEAEDAQGQFYLKMDGDERYWLVSDYVRSNIFKKLSELQPDKKS